MKHSAVRLFLSCLLLSSTAFSGAQAAESLRLIGHSDLAGYTGDFDHSAADLKGNRLLVAAEDHGTLEVFDLKTGNHLKTVKGDIETPHSIFLLPKEGRILVTDSGKTMTKVLDGVSYGTAATLKLAPGADSIGYDAPRNRLYIVTGGKDVDMKESYLSEIDPDTLQHYGDIKFDSNHTEAMAVEQNGPHIFINITDKNYLAVVDKNTRKITAKWPIKEAKQNAPIAFDEENHRLFVVTRDPGMLLVLDSETGATIAHFKAPARCDEAIFDRANRRVYVLGGEGYIGVYKEIDPDHYAELAHIASAPGAKTGVLVPQLNRLFVNVSPGDQAVGGHVLQYEVLPGGGDVAAGH
jgi:DNA-binding beta-propeller fold protein YncE